LNQEGDWSSTRLAKKRRIRNLFWAWTIPSIYGWKSEFLALATEIRIKPEIQEFALEDANEALVELKTRRIRGAKVLKID
jgi:hypothetical protein